MSGIVSCDQAVFAYICSFLEFKDKLPRLLPTCKAIAPSSNEQSSSTTNFQPSFSYDDNRRINPSLFDVSTCCRHDTLFIHRSMGHISDATDSFTQRFDLVPLMRHVVISLECFAKVEMDAVLSRIEDLAVNNDLESLCIYDDRHIKHLDDQPSTLITVYFMAIKRNGKSRKLRQLHWAGFGQPCIGPDAIDWSVMDMLCHLEDISWSFSLRSKDDDNSEERVESVRKIHEIFRNLPDSLKHVSLRVGWLEPGERFDWNVAFQSPTFLPRLESFRYDDNSRTADLNLSSLETTVMQATCQLRPIRMLRLYRLDQQSFHNLDSLTVLFLECTQDLPCPVFDDTVMPNLMAFCFSGHRVMTQLDSYMVFLARRPIEWLDLLNVGSLHTTDGVQALASMRHLCYLSFRDTAEDGHNPLFDAAVTDEQLENLLPANILPNLRHLSGHFDQRSLGALLRAAPGLRQVISLHNDVIETLITIGRYCPLIESVVMTGTSIYIERIVPAPYAMTYESMAERLNGVERSDNMFTHLVHLGLADWPTKGLTTPAFRLLMNEFMHAPLHLFDPPLLITSMYTLASYFMVRDLPLVRGFRGKADSDAMRLYKSSCSRSSDDSLDDYKQPHFDSAREFEYVERVYISASKWPRKPVSDTDEFVLIDISTLEHELELWSKPLDIEELFRMCWYDVTDSTYTPVPSPRDCFHFRFRSEHDGEGLSGREAFLMRLHDELSDNEKALLDNCVADDEVDHTTPKLPFTQEQIMNF